MYSTAVPELVRTNNDLVRAVRRARLAAAVAIATSHAIVPRSRQITHEAVALRLASRAHLGFARITGEVDGRPVVAVVRSDSRVSGSPALLARAEMVTAVGDTFADGRIRASLDVSPLATTLTVARACDRIESIDLLSLLPNGSRVVSPSVAPAAPRSSRPGRSRPCRDRSAG